MAGQNVVIAWSLPFRMDIGRRRPSSAHLRCDGLTAPLTIDGAINGELFQAYVEQVLVPTLKPDDVVIMDNLRVHKMAGVRQAIKATGARLLFIPPFSPDLNPIELPFSKLKAC